jgi:hypothetical protein
MIHKLLTIVLHETDIDKIKLFINELDNLKYNHNILLILTKTNIKCLTKNIKIKYIENFNIKLVKTKYLLILPKTYNIFNIYFLIKLISQFSKLDTYMAIIKVKCKCNIFYKLFYNIKSYFIKKELPYIINLESKNKISNNKFLQINLFENE